MDVDTLRHALSALTNTAVLYLKVGHGVQFGNFGSLQPSINVKAVTNREDCTVKTMIGGVKINMQPTGQFAKAIAEMKVQLVNVSAAEKSESGDDNSDVAPAEGNDTNNTENSGNQQSQEQVKYRITFKFADNTEDDHEYAAGETINYPTNTKDYVWPASKPTVMPAQNVTVTEEWDINQPPPASGGGESGFE